MSSETEHTRFPSPDDTANMKLLIVLSLIAYGYADKLDRTYLPPPGAATAGGSPGSLTAPGQQSFGQQTPGFRGSQTGRPFDSTGPSMPSGFGANQPAFGQARPSQPSGSAFGQAKPNQPGASGFGQARPNQPSGQPGFGQARPNQAGFGQTGAAQGGSAGFGQPAAQGSAGFGQAKQPAGTGVQPPFSQTQPQYSQNAGQAQGNFGSERPQASSDRTAEILRYDNQNNGETFSYNFETSNGIAAEESGVATNGVHAQGGYSYTGDDGQFYKITYTADENGYVPQGDHLPTPPPIPDEILRSIDENARAAAAGTQEGAYNPDEDNSPQYNAPSFNQGQQQFRGSNGFGPSGSGQAQTGSQGGSGLLNQGSQGPQGGSSSFNQGSQGPQGSSGSSFNQGSQGPQGGSGSFNQGSQGYQGQGAQSFNVNQGGQRGQNAQGQGYDYSRPQNRQPSGSPNAIPSGSKSPAQPGSFPGQSQPSRVGGNQRQYLAPEANQPQRSGSHFGAGQSFNQGPQPQRTGSQPGSGQQSYNQGSQTGPQRLGSQTFGAGQQINNQGSQAGPRSQPGSQPSQYNQNQGFGSGSQPTGPSTFSQNRPTSQSQGFGAQRPQSQGQRNPQTPRGQGNGQDGYEYNRPQSSFNSGNQGQAQFQGQNALRPQGQAQNQPGFLGTQGQSQPQFPGTQSQSSGFPGTQGQSQFPGSSSPSQSQGSAPQFPGPRGQGTSNQRQETFGGPRQPPSFSPEEGYKY